MRVMYVASQPQDGSQLNVGREISNFQQKLLSRQLPEFEMLFYSDLSVQNIRSEIAAARPDILHISAHSDDGIFRFRNDNNEVVPLRASDFMVILPDHAMPQLAIFSSCDSAILARELKDGPAAIIGFEGRVHSDVAFHVTLQLYEDLLLGKPLSKAFAAAKARTRLEQKRLDLVLAPPEGLHEVVLYRPPAIVARVTRQTKTETDIELGLDDAPLDLVQVVFFTDNRAWAPDDDYPRNSLLSLECWRASMMAKIVYGPVSEGRCLWSQTTEVQPCDERLFAAVVRASRPPFVVATTVSAAIHAAVDRGLVEDRDAAQAAAQRLKILARKKSN